MSRPLRIAVLVSGGGSNLQALIDAGLPGCEIALVVSNRPDAGALERARAAGIPTAVITSTPGERRTLERSARDAAVEKRLETRLSEARIELIVLAGYLRILSPRFVRRWPRRILNIHPALLPDFGGPGFYGRHVHEAVLASGARESGATVHLVTAEVDGGPVLAQERVLVEPDDTVESLAARVLAVEHRLLPATVAAYAAKLRERRLRVMVVGGGGREHALVRGIAADPRVDFIHALPGNGGIAELATCFPIAATDLDAIEAHAVEYNINFAVVAPDDPLVLGLVDRLEARGIRAFGPTQTAARIEGSKRYAKKLMRKYGIPTADFAEFEDVDEARAYLRTQETWPQVLKADGLALGKGVYIAPDPAAAEEALTALMIDRAHGDAGRSIIIEEWLGEPAREITVLTFCDGERAVAMPASMDHKRALDGDKGPNTGGMGVIAPNPLYTPEVAERVRREILEPTVAALRAEGCPFRGCLYLGLMLTDDGPKVIEYNCRFGDPEAQALLPLLESGLLPLLEASADGRLDRVDVEFKDAATCTVILTSAGYPGSYKTGFPIDFGGAEELPDVFVYHAGTKRKGEDVLTSGGRVLAVTARATSLPEAIRLAYEAADLIHFEGRSCRRDIGAAALGHLKEHS